MPRGGEDATRRLLRFYYLITPAFAVVDALLGAPIRASALEDPNLRAAWYGGAFALGLLMRRFPALTAWGALLESSANLLLLLLAVLLPIWSLLDGPTAEAVTFGPVRMANVLLVGAITILAIKEAEARLRSG